MKRIIRNFKKLPFKKRIYLLLVLLLIIFLPLFTITALQQKNLKPKAFEPGFDRLVTPKIAVSITGIVNSGSTSPCGELNRRCCSSIPSCRPTQDNQQTQCYKGFCRLSSGITSYPVPTRNLTPRSVISVIQDSVTVVPNGQKPILSPTPTPISSIHLPN